MGEPRLRNVQRPTGEPRLRCVRGRMGEPRLRRVRDPMGDRHRHCDRDHRYDLTLRDARRSIFPKRTAPHRHLAGPLGHHEIPRMRLPRHHDRDHRAARPARHHLGHRGPLPPNWDGPGWDDGRDRSVLAPHRG